MPRFFFDIRDNSGFHRDEFGDDFDDFEGAKAQVQLLLPDIVSRELPDGELHAVTCEMRDDADRVIYRGEITYCGTRL